MFLFTALVLLLLCSMNILSPYHQLLLINYLKLQRIGYNWKKQILHLQRHYKFDSALILTGCTT